MRNIDIVTTNWLEGNRKNAVELWISMARDERAAVIEALLCESLPHDAETMTTFAYLAFVVGTEERA